MWMCRGGAGPAEPGTEFPVHPGNKHKSFPETQVLAGWMWMGCGAVLFPVPSQAAAGKWF